MSNFTPTTNLAANKALVIVTDTTAPTITSVSSDKTNGSYTTGVVIDIDVTFSEAVTSTGNVTVTLETGDTDRTCTFTVSNSSTGTCNYTVQAGDTTSDLTVSTISGTIADQASNAMSNFVPTTNLAANKALVIDTTAPTLTESSTIGTSFDTTPAYTFSTTEVGTISYGGSCTSVTTSATLGSNTINFNTLPLGTYTNCTITVTDSTSNASASLSVSSFSVNARSTIPVSNSGGSSSPFVVQPVNPTLGCTDKTIFSPITGVKCPNTTPTSITDRYLLNRTLKLGVTGDDVRALQVFLNNLGYILAKIGPGSPGKETTKFGLLTKVAVMKFQKDNDLIPDGVVGPKTREMINR